MNQIIKKNFFSICLTASVIVSMQGCYYDKEELLYPGSNRPVDCTTVQATFSANVAPLVSSKCAVSGCHDATASGGLIFQNYGQINAANDRINIRVIMEKTMPPTGPLSPSEINILKCWIQSGAPNN
jgi:uncharacterized membrane protein